MTQLTVHSLRGRQPSLYDYFVTPAARRMRQEWSRANPRERVRMLASALRAVGIAIATRQLYRYAAMPPDRAFRTILRDGRVARQRATQVYGYVTGLASAPAVVQVPHYGGYEPPPPMPETHYFGQPVKRNWFDTMNEEKQLETHRSEMPNRRRKRLALPSTVPPGVARFGGKASAYGKARFMTNYMYQGPTRKRKRRYRRKKKKSWYYK